MAEIELTKTQRRMLEQAVQVHDIVVFDRTNGHIWCEELRLLGYLKRVGVYVPQEVGSQHHAGWNVAVYTPTDAGKLLIKGNPIVRTKGRQIDLDD